MILAEHIRHLRNHDHDIVVQCCMCQRIQSDGRWVRPPINASNATRYSHGYCPACFSMAMAELELVVCEGMIH